MKDYGVGADVLTHWQGKAAEAPQDPVEVVGRVIAGGRLGLRPTDAELTESARLVVEAVTDRQAVFTERDLLTHVATFYPDGATGVELDYATALVLASALDSGDALTVLPITPRDAVALPDGVTLTTDELTHLLDHKPEANTPKGEVRFRVLPGEPRYTTRLQLEREHRVLTAVHTQSPVTIQLQALEVAATARGLVAEQKEAMRQLAGLEGRLVAVVGPGGSGKTYAIGAYAQAAHASGHHLIGVAPTATAARKLADDLEASWTGTIAMLTHHLDTRTEQLPAGTVIICDEASMVSTRDLARLVETVEPCDGKLVLLGDPHQLPSIDSGGLFHRIVASGDGVVIDLAEVNQCQALEVDRHALHHLREGATRQAIFDYTEAGRLHLGDHRYDTMAAMVDAWWDGTRLHGVPQVRMLAAHRHDVEVLNQLARIRIHDDGLLSGPELETRWGGVFQVGDRIVVRENWYRHQDLRNGQTGTITSVNPTPGSLAFRRDHDGAEISLPRRYVDASVDYGYAQTIHTAQGHTYQQTHLYLDAAVTAEHGYTGLSRARDETHLWIADTPGPSGDCTHTHGQPVVEDRIDVLVRQLTRTGVEPPTTDHDVMVRTATDRQLIAWRDDLTRTLQASPLAHDPSDQLAPFDEAITEARGIVTRFGTSGARAQVLQLQDQRQELVDQVASRQPWIEDNAHLIHRYGDVVDELDRRITARTLLYQHDPPEDVLGVLGPRPTGTEAPKWDAAVQVYARVRLHAGPDADLGDPAVLQGGQWRDIIYQANPMEQRAPVLRRTG